MKDNDNAIWTGIDPLSINSRLYRRLGRLLDKLEQADARDELMLRDEISAMIAIGRLQKMFADLRKNADDGSVAGSAVRKYAPAFTTAHATGRGKGRARSGSGPRTFDPDTDEDDDRDDAG